MEMEFNTNEMSMMNDFITTVEKNSELVRAENGLSKIVIDNDFWEELKYQMYLKREIEKGKWSAKNEPTLTIDEFSKRIGL